MKELQLNDNKISILTKEINKLTTEISNLKNEFERKTNDFQQKEEEKKDSIKERHQLELDVDVFDNKIIKLKDQQFNVKTNKEYTSLLEEVDNYNEEKNHVEDAILAKMEQLDEIEQVLKKLKNELVEDEKILSTDVVDKEKEIKLSQEEITRLEDRKKVLLDSFKQDFKASYNAAFKKYKGEAVVLIKKQICQGCFMTLPPQIINEVLMGEKVIICENCGRILISDFALEEDETK